MESVGMTPLLAVFHGKSEVFHYKIIGFRNRKEILYFYCFRSSGRMNTRDSSQARGTPPVPARTYKGTAATESARRSLRRPSLDIPPAKETNSCSQRRPSLDSCGTPLVEDLEGIWLARASTACGTLWIGESRSCSCSCTSCC